MKKSLLKNNGVQSLIASLLCIVLGLFLGYLVLLLINPAGAGEAILTVIKNFMTYNRPASQLKYFGNTLVKTAPLLMCALAILFAYKVGLFNIGAAGQYCAGVALSLYAALGLGWSWLPCPTTWQTTSAPGVTAEGPAGLLEPRDHGLDRFDLRRAVGLERCALGAVFGDVAVILRAVAEDAIVAGQ